MVRDLNLPEKDKKLINSFVEKLLRVAPPSLSAVILFGSLARGNFHKASDIDILLVYNEENPRKHLQEVAKVISELKPHREIRPVFTNLKDLDPSLLREVLKEGVVLFGKLILTPDNIGLRPYKVFSYDLSSSSSTVKTRVARLIYGYVSEKKVGEKIKRYEYKGLINRKDCFVLGRGVIALPLEDAEGFKKFLEINNIKFRTIEVWI